MQVERADEARLNSLWKSPIFNFLSAEEMDDLSTMMTAIFYGKDEFIFNECEHPRKLHVVASGGVKILKQSEDGKEVILDIAVPGDLFGAVAIFDGKPYAETAQALEDSVVLSLDRADFFTFLRKNPDVALEIITELGAMVRNYQDTIRALASERVEWRIARIILNLARKSGVSASESIAIDIPVTRKDIAEMAGTTVETAIRVISNFKKLGICEAQRKRIVIIDRKRLESMVTEGCVAAA